MTELYTPAWPPSAPGLVDVIQAMPGNLIGCELGVCRGENARYLLDRATNIVKLYAIDPWVEYDEGEAGTVKTQGEMDEWKNQALRTLAPLGDRVVIIGKTSADAVNDIQDEGLDYIFIDGDHTYGAVLNDCIMYWNKVKSGGLFSGHDWHLSDVNRAVTEFRTRYNITTEIKFTTNNVWYWYK